MARKDGKPGRLKQIVETYKLTAKNDPKIGFILAGIFLGILAIFILAGFIFDLVLWLTVVGVSVALLGTTVVFGRRAEKSAYRQIEGQAGAAAAVLKSLRSGWFVTPAVTMTKSQDVVHRVIGKPGVILVSEGPESRVISLLATERKKTARYVPDVQIIEIMSGNDANQVPLRKLNRKVIKQRKSLKPAQVTEVRKRLEALGTAPVAAPKGPMPKSVRASRGQRR